MDNFAEAGLNTPPPVYNFTNYLIGKIIYRDTCDSKISWGKFPLDWIVKTWDKWEKKLPTKVNIPRIINLSQRVSEMINVHVFGDAIKV